LFGIRAFSSVGLERYLDRVEVTGSNPVMPTSKRVIGTLFRKNTGDFGREEKVFFD
jgi:hypothetical protein